MMDYMDHMEVLEALGFDLAGGGRDWVGDYHKQDLIALSNALYLAQRGQVVWKSKVASDPFRQDFEARLMELMIVPCVRGRLYEVAPSYYTYRPSMQYLLDATLYFYKSYLPEEFRLDGVHYERQGHRFVIHAESGWNGLQEVVRISAHTEYENGPRMRAELMRVLCRSNEQVIEHNLGRRGQVRDYFMHTLTYIDELWGMHSPASI